jgi:hypothetical protein
MADKLQFFSTEIFFEKPFYQPSGQQIMQMTVFLPIEAISYLTQREQGNPHSAYDGHVKKSYFMNEQFQVKSINPIVLSKEQFDLIK